MDPLKFEQLQEELKNPEVVLIDVRAATEIKADGKIPMSRNIPMEEGPSALNMSETEFKEAFGFDKPDKNCRVICHCKGGMRGQRFATMLKEHGYSNVGVYPGILDWKANDGLLEY